MTPDGKSQRWNIERAVADSTLPPYGRLLLLVLLSNADTKTAIISQRYQPSIRTLVKRTGMADRTVRKHLTILDKRGWLIREQARGHHTTYQVQIGN